MSFEVQNIYPYEIDDFSMLFYLVYPSEDNLDEEEIINSFFISEIEMLEFDKDDFIYNTKKDTFSLRKNKEVLRLFRRFSANKELQTKNTFFTRIKGVEIKSNDVQTVEYKKQKEYIERLDLNLFAEKISESLNEVIKQAIAYNAISLLSENYLLIKSSRKESKRFYSVLKTTLFFNKTKELFWNAWQQNTTNLY